ncbi:MAG: LytTR family DNA-binding domain-containing protein [Gelidibacter sp.]
MKCIIVDDEPLAINVINSYCGSVDALEVQKTFTNALEALDYLNSHEIDVLFIDIEMPQISGIDFIKSLVNDRPFIIFTTAYPQYALDGFDLNAVDYLVKPVPFPRFITAINRVKEIYKLKHQKKANLVPSGIINNSNEDFIFVKSEYENLKLKLSEIRYIQGLKDYLKIHLIKQKPTITLMNFKTIEGKLASSNFVRVHRSFIVNIEYIGSIQRNQIIMDDGMRIPIGESYKEGLFEILGI